MERLCFSGCKFNWSLQYLGCHVRRAHRCTGSPGTQNRFAKMLTHPAVNQQFTKVYPSLPWFYYLFWLVNMPLTDRWFQAKNLDPDHYPRYGCWTQEMPGRTLVGPHVVDGYERHLKAVGAPEFVGKVSYLYQENSDGISWDSKGSNGFLEDFWLAELVERTPRLYGDYTIMNGFINQLLTNLLWLGVRIWTGWKW